MKVVEAHHISNVVYPGYLGFRGSNPNIQLTGVKDADYIWYYCWGDGGAGQLDRDLSIAAALAYTIDKPLISVVTSDAQHEHAIPHRYQHLHFATGALEPYRQIPYSEHFSDCYPDAENRPFLASFKGSLNTYLPRSEMLALAAPDVIIESVDFWALQPGQHGPHHVRYEELMKSSRYSLCPRGRGLSSVRLTESIRFHCVPVMIDDASRLFGDPMDFAIRITSEQLPGIVDCLRSISDSEYQERKRAMAVFRDTYLDQDRRAGCQFVYGSCHHTEYIRKTIENATPPPCPDLDRPARIL